MTFMDIITFKRLIALFMPTKLAPQVCSGAPPSGAPPRRSVCGLLVCCALSLFTTLLLTAPAYALSPPTITPVSGSFTSAQSVSMSASAGTIYLTLDGSVPTTSSTQYTAAFTVNTTTQINAVAYQSGTYSTVATAYLDVDPSLAPILAPTGLTLRLRAGFGIATGLGAPPPISTWSDLSGSSNDATGTAGSQPLWLFNQTNGLPAVNFDGATQYLSFPSGFANLPNGASLFIVIVPTSLTANAHIFDLGTGSSGNNIESQIASSGSTGQLWAYNGTSGTNAQSASALTQNQCQLLEAVQAAGSPNATATFYVNGAPGSANASMNNFPNITRTNNFLAQASNSGNFYGGNIAEVLLYTSVLTASQRIAVEAYLMQKYQILSQVPTAPIISVATSTLNEPTQVAMSSPPDTTIRYTVDGSTPSTTSPVYTGTPLTINYSQTLKAIATKYGIASSIASATYTLDSTQWPAPSPSDVTAPTINLQLPTPSL